MIKIIIISLMLASILTACSSNKPPQEQEALQRPVAGGQADSTAGSLQIVAIQAMEQIQALHETFPAQKHTERAPMSGGVLNLAIIPDAQAGPGGITGIMHPLLALSRQEANIINILNPNLLAFDQNGRMIQGEAHHGPVLVAVDTDAQTITLTLRDGINIFWHDGVALTLDDIRFQLYTSAVMNLHTNLHDLIRGMHAYQQGQADYISGLSISNDARTLQIAFTEMPASLQYESLLGLPLARHHFQDIDHRNVLQGRIADIHVNFRDLFIGFGPFKIDYIIPNERIKLVRNEYYWQGAPLLDAVIVHQILPGALTDALVRGTVDVSPIAENHMHDLSDSFAFLGNASDFAEFFYFNLGHVRTTTNELGHRIESIVPRADDHPITDVRFRRALAYAVNQEQLNAQRNTGLAVPAISFLNLNQHQYSINANSLGLSEFNPDRANEILDAMNFNWGAHGLRNNAYDQLLYVTVLMSEVGGDAQFVFDVLHENFATIGIELRRLEDPMGQRPSLGMLADFARYNRFNFDFHMILMPNFMAGATLKDTFYSNSNLNFSGFYNTELDDLLHETESLSAWDPVYLANIYREIDALLTAEVPALLGAWRFDLTAVHHRVNNWSVQRGTYIDGALQLHLVSVFE